MTRRRVAPLRQALHTALRRHRVSPQPSAPAWQDVAAQVHREVGGDLAALQEAAEQIESAHDQMVAYRHGAGLDGRLALVTLTPVPALVVAIRQLLDPGYITRLAAGPRGWLSLATAGTLTVIAALWLWRITKPPFAASPPRWRAHRENERWWLQVTAAVDRAWLYAVAGLDREAALGRAMPEEPQPVRWLLANLLGAGDWADVVHPSPPPRDEGRVAVLLSEASVGTPADALAEVRARLHRSRMDETDAQARKLPLATFVPFAVCVLPAALIVGLVGWS